MTITKPQLQKRAPGMLSATMVKRIALLLLGAMMLHLAAPAAAFAQDDPRAVNIRFIVTGQKVIITYDLEGERNKKYAVSVFLRKESDSTRSYRPRTVSGAVGENVTAGTDQEIVWDLHKDIPAGLEGNDYYFVIAVEEQSSGFPWWVGAAVVGAGLMSLLVFSTGTEEKKESTLPPPPGRP